MYCIDHQQSRLVTWLQTKNIKVCMGTSTIVVNKTNLISNEIILFSYTNLAFLVWYLALVLSSDDYFLFYSKLKLNMSTYEVARQESIQDE